MQAIRLLKKITLILMTPDWCRDEMPVGHLFNFAGNTPAEKITLILITPDWCRDEMPVGHHFLTGFAWLCLLIRIGQTGLKKKAIRLIT